LAIVSLVVGFTADGGSLSALVQPTAILIVIGGTLGATILATVVAEGALALEEHMDGFQIRS